MPQVPWAIVSTWGSWEAVVVELLFGLFTGSVVLVAFDVATLFTNWVSSLVLLTDEIVSVF